MATVPIARLTNESFAKGLRLTAPTAEKAVYAFLGIPYAEPPVDSLRFKPTKHLNLWKGKRDCTKYGKLCYVSFGYNLNSYIYNIYLI